MERRDGLVREPGGLGGRHAGVLLPTQPGQQGQDMRPFKSHLGIRVGLFGQ